MISLFSKQSLRTFSKKYFSTWSNVPQAPPDPILGISEAFKKDTSSNKVSLGVGAYRDDNGKPVVLNSVKRALDIIHSQNLDNEYLPVQGLESFIQGSVKLAYGEDHPALQKKKIAGVQTLSGTGGVRLGWDFCKKYLKKGINIYIPKHTWPNHRNICAEIDFPFQEYRYLDTNTKALDFSGMKQDLEEAPEQSLFLFHVCSHNPTGVDPTKEQWRIFKDIVKQKNHIAFFDSAYQGFTTGNLDEDAFSFRLFAQKEDITVMLAQSFAKNFGLYGQRIGCLSTICESEEEANRVQSQLKIIARRNYSNPPLHGARIVSTVLNNPELYQLWLDDIKVMADRIKSMRQALKDGILKNGSKLNWDHITNQIGMFAYTGISQEAVKRLTKEYHIYLTADGRISISGLNSKNVDYVAKAFHEVTK